MSEVIARHPFRMEMATAVDPHTGETYEYIARKELASVDVRCDCGRVINCSGFTTTCECGRDYNWNGDQLAPRRFWGEETGESYADIAYGHDEEDW